MAEVQENGLAFLHEHKVIHGHITPRNVLVRGEDKLTKLADLMLAEALEGSRLQQTIRETLLNRKDQLLKAAYYEVARNDAKVVNYLARSVVDNAGKAAK